MQRTSACKSALVEGRRGVRAGGGAGLVRVVLGGDEEGGVEGGRGRHIAHLDAVVFIKIIIRSVIFEIKIVDTTSKNWAGISYYDT